MRTARRRKAVEFAEEFTQECEDGGAQTDAATSEVAREFQAAMVAPRVGGGAG